MSMRILDLQRRLREVGRIRIGEQTATQGGRKRPVKLEVFRLTSRDRAVIEAAAAAYGGTAEPWQDAPDAGLWQVKTTATEFQVIVPPGDMAFSQAYEQWTAGGCKVRCDGQWDHLADKACHCDPTNRSCVIHTRLSVMLPDLPGLGVWRLDTSGYYAAVELGGVVDLAAGYAERGQMLPARLRLEQRSVKRAKPDGKVETRRFAVPVLDLDVHPMALAGGTAAPALTAGPSFQPVPAELPTPPAAPVADQVPSLGGGEPTRKRKNAATPIPATGIAPRAAVDASDDLAPPAIGAVAGSVVPEVVDSPAEPLADEARRVAIQLRIDNLSQEERQDLGGWWKGQGYPALKSGDLTVEQADAIERAIDAYAGAGPADARNRKMWALVAEAWPDDTQAQRDKVRKALIGVVTDARSESSKDLNDPEWDDLFVALEAIASGSMELHLRSTGDYELRQRRAGKAAS